MSALKFLPGLIVVQVAAAALAVVVAASGGIIGWTLAAIVACTLTLIVGLWFGSIADHIRKDALTDLREEFTRDREHLLVAAEVDKRSIIEESHRRIIEESRQAHARANFKLGAAVSGMVGIAGILLYIELFTLALVTATTAGGALAGYLVRARQDGRLLRRPEREVRDTTAVSVEELLAEAPSKPVRAPVRWSGSRPRV